MILLVRGWADDLRLFDQLQIDHFLCDSNWRIKPSACGELVIEGVYELDAKMDGFSRVQETYNLRIVIKERRPEPVVLVYELGGKIPKNAEHHINLDGSFCLGASIKLLSLASPRDGLHCYFETCVLPFLYKVTHLIKYKTIPDELAHYTSGLVDQYSKLFKISGIDSIYRALLALSLNWRNANKVKCPCDCGQRLGVCEYRWFLKERWRYRIPRSEFKREANQLRAELIEAQKNNKTKKRRNRKLSRLRRSSEVGK